MRKESLIAALRKAESEKFNDIAPEEEIGHAFSERFERRMHRLIRLQRQPLWKMGKNPIQRSILLVLILLLTFGVPPEKNPLFRMAQPIPQLSTAVPPPAETYVPTERNEPIAQAQPDTPAPIEQAPSSEPRQPNTHVRAKTERVEPYAPITETASKAAVYEPETVNEVTPVYEAAPSYSYASSYTENPAPASGTAFTETQSASDGEETIEQINERIEQQISELAREKYEYSSELLARAREQSGQYSNGSHGWDVFSDMDSRLLSQQTVGAAGSQFGGITLSRP